MYPCRVLHRHLHICHRTPRLDLRCSGPEYSMRKTAAIVAITIIVPIITGLIMSKRSTYTTITPLPEGVTRATVLETLHTHTEMIDLNPLVQERHPIKPPAKASPEEYHCQWYEITDTVQYLPGGVLSGSVSFNACFHDLADGIQTHIYAPMGLEIRGRWTVGGSLPGEPQVPVEIGKGIPITGLYLREDSNVKCNILMAPIVKRNMKHSHAALVQRIIARAQVQDAQQPDEPRSEPTPIEDHFSSKQESAQLPLSSPQLAYNSLHHSPLSSPGYPPPPPPIQNLYSAPLNVRGQNPNHAAYPQQYDPRFSTQSYGAPVYQHLDPVYAATNPHWQPQIPVQTQTQAQYLRYQQQQTGYVTGPQELASMEPVVKKDSKSGVDPAGPPAHPGNEPAEME